MSEVEEPRTPSRCWACVFLGHSGIYDLYWCADFREPVAIDSSNGDMGAGLTGWDFFRRPILSQAFQRGLAEGVVDDASATYGLSVLHEIEEDKGVAIL